MALDDAGRRAAITVSCGVALSTDDARKFAESLQAAAERGAAAVSETINAAVRDLNHDDLTKLVQLKRDTADERARHAQRHRDALRRVDAAIEKAMDPSEHEAEAAEVDDLLQTIDRRSVLIDHRIKAAEAEHDANRQATRRQVAGKLRKEHRAKVAQMKKRIGELLREVLPALVASRAALEALEHPSYGTE
jgi:hypothetical protein